MTTALAVLCVLAGAQDLVILHTNDTHSHIDPVRAGENAGLGGVIERAAFVDSVRNAAGEGNVLLVDAGDFSQGSSYFTLMNGDIEIDVMNMIYQFPPMDTMLASIFGGALLGLGIGLVFAKGATTGGTDLIARLLKLKFAWLPMGTLVLFPDFMVIALVAIAFGKVESALYGVVSLFVTTKVMDTVLYGMDSSKVAYIISDAYEEIARAITHDMERGLTLLHGEGGWSGTDKKVLMVAFKQRQIVAIKRTVTEIDPAAFLIVCDAHEVLGDGFREYKQNDL